MDKNHRDVYTPQITTESAFLLRCIAWAANKPMTISLDACIQDLADSLDKKRVCGSCKDRRCLECPISFERWQSKLLSVRH